jgi:hypothetical protein
MLTLATSLISLICAFPVLAQGVFGSSAIETDRGSPQA